MGLGYLESVTHDYVRQRTTILFAALNTATGEVIAQCKPRRLHQEFLAFLRHVDQAVPADLDMHLIVDNYATHKHPEGQGVAGSAYARYHMHFTWFGLISQQPIRRGSFKNVRQFITSIERYIEKYNQHGRAFAWTTTADSILQKVARLCKVTSGIEH